MCPLNGVPLRTTPASNGSEMFAFNVTTSCVASNTGKPMVSVLIIAFVENSVMVAMSSFPAGNACITNGEAGTVTDRSSRQLAASYRIMLVETENLFTSAEQVTPSDALDRTLRKARTVSVIIMTASSFLSTHSSGRGFLCTVPVGRLCCRLCLATTRDLPSPATGDCTARCTV